MRDILVTDKAFQLPPKVEINEQEFAAFLKKIYAGKNPFYQRLRNFTGASKPTYSAKSRLYKKQLHSLFKQWLAIFSVEANDSGVVATAARILMRNLTDHSVFAGSEQEQERAYSLTKLYLEKILFLIKDFTPAKKQEVLKDVAEKIGSACGGGIFTQLADILYGLQSEDTLPFWLANARKNYLHFQAERAIAKRGTADISSIHIHIAFIKKAEKMGWGVPLSDELAPFYDQYRQDLNALEESELELDFENQNTREKIIELVQGKFYGLLSHYKTIDLTLSDYLSAFQKVVAPFEQHGIFDLNILEMNDEGETHIKAEFWDRFPEYCVTLLEKEGYLLDQDALLLLQKKKEAEICDLVQRKDSARLQELLLISSSTNLVEALTFAPDELAIQMLDLLGPKLNKHFAKEEFVGTGYYIAMAKVTSLYELLGTLYRLPKSKAKLLVDHLGLGNEQYSEASDELYPLLDNLIYSRKLALVRDRHPLRDLFKAASKEIKAQIFVDDEIMAPLELERDRLSHKYGKSHERVVLLNKTLASINAQLDNWHEGNEHSSYVLGYNLRMILENELINNPVLDKYEGWGQKLGLVLLNVLMAFPLFLPAVVKYALTGSCFFSLQGQTYEKTVVVHDKTDELLSGQIFHSSPTPSAA